jgi:DNA (cytosine-5)-methyltransferase 1
VNVLDLFSGIGGFSLGLERAGMRTVAFCEIEPYARAVLAKHWPNVPCYDDVRTLTADRLRADGIIPDVICGGFPCQDISHAGAGAGIDGSRSGLWSEYARLIGEIRPRYVIVENVAALLGRGLERVLSDLAALGYDAEWHCIPACYVGAPHRRDRIWIVANPQGIGRSNGYDRELFGSFAREINALAGASGAVDKLEAWGWAHEPNVGRVAHGVPSRIHRIKCLGNAVVPQIPQIIGEAIMAVHRQS